MWNARKSVALLVFVVAGASANVWAQVEPQCGSLQSGGLGPLDYRTASVTHKRAVEGVHFTPDVESLKAGATSGRIGADIAYTLGVFPNHPRALVAMARLAEVQKRPKPRGAKYSVDCYFERAVRFTPDDGNVRLLFGTYLLIRGQSHAAVEQLHIAEKQSGGSANVSYNLGLAYFELKDYQKAREYAKRARERGNDLPGLQNKLRSVGQWQE